MFIKKSSSVKKHLKHPRTWRLPLVAQRLDDHPGENVWKFKIRANMPKSQAKRRLSSDKQKR